MELWTPNKIIHRPQLQKKMELWTANKIIHRPQLEKLLSYGR